MSPLSRRKVLGVVGAGIGVSVAGCQVWNTTPDPEAHVPDDWHEEPVQGTGSPVETSAAIDDTMRPTYHPDREEVELSNGEFRSVDHWLGVECPHLAGRYLDDVLGWRLDDREYVSAGIVSDGELWVRRVVHARRDGEVTGSPDVEFDAVVEATPQYVEATVTLDEFEHTCRPPVYVEDSVSQEE